MSSILESVEWGKSALTLLAQCNKLDPNLPAVMHIRHTERPRIRRGSKDGDRILSTELGRKAAYEFGAKLPRNRRYRFYHTYIDRSKETAEEIHRGILSNNGVSEIGDLFHSK